MMIGLLTASGAVKRGTLVRIAPNMEISRPLKEKTRGGRRRWSEIGDGQQIGVVMTIKTARHPPIRQRPYQLRLTKRANVEEEVESMQQK